MIPGFPSLTAEAVALFRAREAGRNPQTRILDDTIAARLLSPPLRALAADPARAVPRVVDAVVGRVLDGVVPGLATAMVARHRFLDDALLCALSAHDTRTGAVDVEQVVILGAGLDSRAQRFRTALAGRPVFEVDFAASQERKVRALRSAGFDDETVDAAVRVACDFTRERFPDALARSPRFAAGRRTFVVWEGVSMYLPREAVRRTLVDVARTFAPGSLLGVDFWFLVDGRDLASRLRRALPHVVGAVGEPFLFSLRPEEAPDFLRPCGFSVVDSADPAVLSTRYVKDGRPVAPSFHVLLARVGGSVDAGPGERP